MNAKTPRAKKQYFVTGLLHTSLQHIIQFFNENGCIMVSLFESMMIIKNPLNAVTPNGGNPIQPLEPKRGPGG